MRSYLCFLLRWAITSKVKKPISPRLLWVMVNITATQNETSRLQEDFQPCGLEGFHRIRVEYDKGFAMTSKVWGSYCLYKIHQISYYRVPEDKEQLNTFKENLLSWKAAISKHREIHVAFYSSWKYDVLTLRCLKEGRALVTFIFLPCHAWRGWLGYCREVRFWDVN